MKIAEKIAYLKGVADGSKLSSESKKGKLIKGILDVLEEIAASIELLENENETLEDYITEVDEDLGDLEENFEKIYCKVCRRHDKTKETDEDEYIDDGKESVDEAEEEDYDDTEEPEEENEEIEIPDGILEWKCPHCKKHVYIKTEEILRSDTMVIDCPECGREIQFIEENNAHACSNCAAAQQQQVQQPPPPDIIKEEIKEYDAGDLGNLRETLRNSLQDIEERLNSMKLYNQ